MSIFSLIVGGTTILLAIATAYFESKQMPKVVFRCAIATAICATIALVAQYYEQIEADRKTDLIIGNVSGGEGNKPFPRITFTRAADSSFDFEIELINCGDFPIRDIVYHYKDWHTPLYEFLRRNSIVDTVKATKWQMEKIRNFKELERKREQSNINIPILSRNEIKKVHRGKIAKNQPLIHLGISLIWGNQDYTASHLYILDSGTYKLASRFLFDIKGNKYDDAAAFFPFVPKNVLEDSAMKLQMQKLIKKF